MRPSTTVLVCMLGLAGCGESLDRAQIADLAKRLDESQRRQAQSEKKLDALEDKVFLLTDQLESQKVASVRSSAPAPRLPVVTLRPSSSSTTASSDDVSSPETAVPGDIIEYRGDAASPTPDKAREPFLHLDGTRREPTQVRRASLPPPSTNENLGVAPAPDVAQAAHRSPATTVVDEHEPDSDPLALYKSAYAELKAGRHDAAARGFREFVKRYPRHDYADNAQYWLGECFYARKMYVEAAVEFRAVVEKYPLGNKAPDALLKLAYCMIALGDVPKGRELLGQLPQSYPRTDAARLAEGRLAELGTH